MHHDLPGRLDLLQTIKWHVIEVASAVEIPFLITHDLFEEMVSTSFPLLLFEEQVVGGGDLVVLVVLDVSYRLAQVAVRIYARRREAVLDFAEVLVQHRNSVLANYYALHL